MNIDLGRESISEFQRVGEVEKIVVNFAVNYMLRFLLQEINDLFLMRFESWMDLGIVIVSEVNQTDKEILYDITYMWNLKRNDTNELIYETETDSQT